MVPVFQVLPWLGVQEDHHLNLWKCVGISDDLYFPCQLGPFFQQFWARIISWVRFRGKGISGAFEGGVRTGIGGF